MRLTSKPGFHESPAGVFAVVPNADSPFLECDQCHDRTFVILYHACRDRHWPRWRRRASQDGCKRQRAAVLPVTYHHRVFTLSDTLNGWVEVYPQDVCGLRRGSQAP